MAEKLKETDLYAPVKALLEGQGYVVKAEIGAVDVMAVRAGDDPVIVELKTGFSLSLFHQAVARQSICDDVYVAVPRSTGRRFQLALQQNTGLCRRLGLGLITVRLSDDLVEIHVDPARYVPRQSKTRRGRLLREFAKREGDPNLGGQSRAGLVTAYRQDALKCAQHLAIWGACKGSVVRDATHVATATRIMAADHYGWFERVGQGVYRLTPKGRRALDQRAPEQI